MRARPYRAALILFAAASGTAAASEGGGGGLGQALISPHIGTIFWTLVTFIIMLIILGRYAWGPLLGAVQAREKSIEDDLGQARHEREDAERLLKEHQELVAQARRERAEALSQGQRDAEKVKAEILEEARQQREQLLKQTERQVDAALRQAKDELRAATADLAIQAAGKLLSKNLDDATQRSLVEGYLTDLERSSGDAGPPS